MKDKGEGNARDKLARQLLVSQSWRKQECRTHRMKERSKTSRQNVDEEKQVKVSYKS